MHPHEQYQILLLHIILPGQRLQFTKESVAISPDEEGIITAWKEKSKG